MKAKLKLSLTWQILIALVLGFLVGMLMQGNVEFAKEYIYPIGTIFLRLLKFVVVPLVLVSIILGLISMKDVSTLGRLGLRALLYFVLTTVFAVTLGLVVSTLLKGILPVIDMSGMEKPQLAETQSFVQQIVNMFPENAVRPLEQGDMMQVIVIALLFGFAIVKLGDKAKIVSDFCVSFNEVVMVVLGFVMRLTPYGVFCLLCPVVAENGAKIFGTYAALIGMAFFCFFLHAIIVYANCVWAMAKMRPGKFFKGMFPAMLFAFSSDSSLATLPVTIRCAEGLGVRKSITNFVLPLGATINMDGVAIYLGVTSVFVANCCGIDLSMQQYMAIVFASTIASVGTPGIPGGSLALMAMVFASAGIPIEGVAVVAGIDRLIDMGRTTMSITGDASCAVIMEHFENE
ncbi:MAG: dicarboxylate/amino acid:cation symporter [Prevotellaceae bacterium]|nr:dicarboxylate/amino acid:cation symporter [Prevotellaceae bacterium]